MVEKNAVYRVKTKLLISESLFPPFRKVTCLIDYSPVESCGLSLKKGGRRRENGEKGGLARGVEFSVNYQRMCNNRRESNEYQLPGPPDVPHSGRFVIVLHRQNHLFNVFQFTHVSAPTVSFVPKPLYDYNWRIGINAQTRDYIANMMVLEIIKWEFCIAGDCRRYFKPIACLESIMGG